jgi:hypothetical protein
LPLILLLGMTPTTADEAEEVLVRVQTAQAVLRSSPQPLGEIRYTLSYGDAAVRREVRDGWVLLAPEARPGFEGWTHHSAVTQREIEWAAGEETVDSGASSDELALAGKGFDEQVEEEYRSQTDLDFTWVDRMSEYEVDQARKREFLEEGGLEPEVEE